MNDNKVIDLLPGEPYNYYCCCCFCVL